MTQATEVRELEAPKVEVSADSKVVTQGRCEYRPCSKLFVHPQRVDQGSLRESVDGF